MTQHAKALPLPFCRMPSRVEAAAYVGVSPSTFDRMISDRPMPGPKRIYGRVLWDVQALDADVDAMSGGDMDCGEATDWDEVLSPCGSPPPRAVIGLPKPLC